MNAAAVQAPPPLRRRPLPQCPPAPPRTTSPPISHGRWPRAWMRRPSLPLPWSSTRTTTRAMPRRRGRRRSRAAGGVPLDKRQGVFQPIYVHATLVPRPCAEMERAGRAQRRGCEPRRRTAAGGGGIYAYPLHLCEARIGREPERPWVSRCRGTRNRRGCRYRGVGVSGLRVFGVYYRVGALS